MLVWTCTPLLNCLCSSRRSPTQRFALPVIGSEAPGAREARQRAAAAQQEVWRCVPRVSAHAKLSWGAVVQAMSQRQFQAQLQAAMRTSMGAAGGANQAFIPEGRTRAPLVFAAPCAGGFCCVCVPGARRLPGAAPVVAPAAPAVAPNPTAIENLTVRPSICCERALCCCRTHAVPCLLLSAGDGILARGSRACARHVQ